MVKMGFLITCLAQPRLQLASTVGVLVALLLGFAWQGSNAVADGRVRAADGQHEYGRRFSGKPAKTANQRRPGKAPARRAVRAAYGRSSAQEATRSPIPVQRVGSRETKEVAAAIRETTGVVPTRQGQPKQELAASRMPSRCMCGRDLALSDGVAAADECGFTCHGRYPTRTPLAVRADYLLWWSNTYQAPPLATTSVLDAPPETSGVLGELGTRVLFGGGRIDSDAASGGRITLNYWSDDCRHTGVEASYLRIGENTTRFRATSARLPILARPYFDLTDGTEAAMLVAHPDFLAGSITGVSTTEFQNVEVLFRSALSRQCGRSVDFVLGWRFAQLDESLRVTHSSEWTEAQGPIVVGTTKDVSDLFDTKNQFHGAELGLLFNERCGPWSLDFLVKVALGNSRSEVFIDGQTVNTVPDGGAATFEGGLLAQTTNMGRYSQDNFAVIPELGVTLRYALNCRLSCTLGYSFTYWNKVARPGDQMDRNVSQLPPELPTGAERPAFVFQTDDFWVQGMNVGLAYRY